MALSTAPVRRSAAELLQGVGSVPRSSNGPVFVLDGKLGRLKVNPSTSDRGGFYHDIQLISESGKVLFCSMYAQNIINISELEGSLIQFGVYSLRTANNASFGTDLGRDFPAVVFVGRLSADMMEIYEEKVESVSK